MIKRNVKTVTKPEETQEVITYETTDGKTFGWLGDAEIHQEYINAQESIKAIPNNGGWYLVRSYSEAQIVWLVSSGGQWQEGKIRQHYISFPAWIKVSAHQDNNRYWHTELEELNLGDLRMMLDEFNEDELAEYNLWHDED